MNSFEFSFLSYLRNIFCTEGLSTPTKGRKFEGMSSKTKMSVKEDVLGQVSTNLQITDCLC